jgi:lipopolysaccharide export system ATP-binding protein
MRVAELLDMMRGLGPHDLSLAVAVTELLRRAGPDGGADRGEWVASVREVYETAGYGRDPSGFPHPAPEGEGVGPYLEQHVLSRLEAAGIATREPGTEGWERLRLAPALWAEVEPRKPEVFEELSSVVRVLQEALTPDPVPQRMETEIAGRSRLRADGLVKVYRSRKVVNDVAIAVSQGEIVALLGPNGAGKTTTFYMIVGLIPPDAGRVFLDEADITETPMFRRARMGVGYLAQEPSIFRKLSVEGNVRAILETLELPKEEEKRRLEELLNELSIAHLRKSKADSLSGGERRRLEITRALVQQPKFLLLDEPFAGIDPLSIADIRDLVKELKRRGIGVLITDHNVRETLDIVDRACIIYGGQVLFAGSPEALVADENVRRLYLGEGFTL